MAALSVIRIISLSKIVIIRLTWCSQTLLEWPPQSQSENWILVRKKNKIISSIPHFFGTCCFAKSGKSARSDTPGPRADPPKLMIRKMGDDYQIIQWNSPSVKLRHQQLWQKSDTPNIKASYWQYLMTMWFSATYLNIPHFLFSSPSSLQKCLSFSSSPISFERIQFPFLIVQLNFFCFLFTFVIISRFSSKLPLCT